MRHDDWNYFFVVKLTVFHYLKMTWRECFFFEKKIKWLLFAFLFGWFYLVSLNINKQFQLIVILIEQVGKIGKI